MNAQKLSLTDILTQVDQLPELPQAALQLSRMMEDPNVSVAQLSNIIRLDMSLTSQLLRLSNSAAYGFVRKISTVKDAVALLGLNTLKSIVYVILSKFALDKPIPGYALGAGTLWNNALTCAVYAKFLTEQYRSQLLVDRQKPLDPELAFTAALLRDIGKLVLGQYVGERYQQLEAMAGQRQMDFETAEQEVLGLSHTMVGERIGAKWNLPDKLIKVIRYHHRPSQLPPVTPDEVVKLATMVHFADACTMMMGIGNGNDGLMYGLDMPALEAQGIGLDQRRVELLISQLLSLNAAVKSLQESFV